jgi:beta-galactosidase
VHLSKPAIAIARQGKAVMLGVCYYPEHWPEDWWADDAARMRRLGLRYVRIGEFAWSRLEPAPGHYDFAWLDRAIEKLGAAGLQVVLCTPTATPPKWLIDAHPEILPVDPETGRTRGFGSRRHSDFSSSVWLTEALRITDVLARRYGDNRHVTGWQTDNELCCHETTLSASPAARDGFRVWLATRYPSIAALNTAWGNVFWSMEYRSFDEIELPVGAVTETSPAHRMAWQRYASDMVVGFHDAMVAILREHSPGRFVTHNFIPMPETGVDNFALAAPLDFASYDNYPLGRADLAMARAPAETFRPWMRTGLPDAQALLFDQTRGLTGRPFWIMEQQPGPVNWALHNPRPAPGMVRLWSWEAFAHGAAVVSFFRWRQLPFAQEQMHAGLLRPDSSEAEAWPEIERLAAELAAIVLPEPTPAPVAMIVDIEAQWLSAIERQGRGYDYSAVVAQYYGALRRLGVDVDFVAPGADLAGYALVVAPALAMPGDAAVAALQAADGIVLIGPRSGAKTGDVTIANGLPPGPLQALLPIRVLAVETLRPDCPEPLPFAGGHHLSTGWREVIDPGPCQILASAGDGLPALVRHGDVHYLTTLTDDGFLDVLLARMCGEAGVAITPVSGGLRLRRRGALHFAINYGDQPATAPAAADAKFLLGARDVAPRDLAIWIVG